MGPNVSLFLVLCLFLSQGAGFFLSDSGKPLLLSSYIEQGEIEKAQFLSRVDPLPEECTDSYLKSYSGFITVQKEYNSNMFFWYIPAQEVDPEKAPLILWLDGGPGASSMMALFVMNGPYQIDENIKMTRREADWTKKFSILYVDNPVGSGFSFTEVDAGYARNQTDVARDLYSFLNQFFTLFPNLRSTDLYIGGESYAGKYVPAISYKIHTENPTATNRINLKGMIMAAPFTDPETVNPVYPDFLYYMGMLNKRETEDFRSEINRVMQLVNSRDLVAAGQAVSQLLFGSPSAASWTKNHTGYSSLINVLHAVESKEMTYFTNYVTRADVRQAIHVGDQPYFSLSATVFSYMMADIMRSVKPWLVTLLNSEQYKILMYGGQMDIVVCTPCIEATIDSMTDWTDIGAYRQAEKKIWRLKPDDGDVAGYIQGVGNFTWAIVRGAGHIGPADQPERHLDLVTRFVEDIPF